MEGDITESHQIFVNEICDYNRFPFNILLYNYFTRHISNQLLFEWLLNIQ